MQERLLLGSGLIKNVSSRSSTGTINLVGFSSTFKPVSTRRLFSREATFSFVGVAYHISKCDAEKEKVALREKSRLVENGLYRG